MSKSKPRKNPKPIAPIYKGDPFVFDVDHILEKRINGNKTEYLIKWSGYADSENSWVEESNVTKDLIKEINSKEKESTATNVSPLDTYTDDAESLSVPEEDQNTDFYFDDDFHNLQCNLLLQSTIEDFQLFSISTKSNGSNVNVSNQDQSIDASTFGIGHGHSH